MGNKHEAGARNKNFLKVKVSYLTSVAKQAKLKRWLEVNRHLTLANEDSNV